MFFSRHSRAPPHSPGDTTHSSPWPSLPLPLDAKTKYSLRKPYLVPGVMKYTYTGLLAYYVYSYSSSIKATTLRIIKKTRAIRRGERCTRTRRRCFVWRSPGGPQRTMAVTMPYLRARRSSCYSLSMPETEIMSLQTKGGRAGGCRSLISLWSARRTNKRSGLCTWAELSAQTATSGGVIAPRVQSA